MAALEGPALHAGESGVAPEQSGFPRIGIQRGSWRHCDQDRFYG